MQTNNQTRAAILAALGAEEVSLGRLGELLKHRGTPRSSTAISKTVVAMIDAGELTFRWVDVRVKNTTARQKWVKRCFPV